MLKGIVGEGAETGLGSDGIGSTGGSRGFVCGKAVEAEAPSRLFPKFP